MNHQTETDSNAAAGDSSATDRGDRFASRLCCGPVLGALAALVAGLLAWGVWQTIGPVFHVPAELRDLPTPAPPEKDAELALAVAEANRQNAILAIAILGAVTGLVLATAECASRRALRSACWKAPLTAVFAGLIGAGAGFAGSFVFESPELLTGWSPLAQTIVVQAVTLGLMGLGVGAGVAIFVGRVPVVVSSALGGILGGTLAAFFYPACAAYLTPAAQTECVLPRDATSRLIWMTMATVLIGLIVTGLGKRGQTATRRV